MRSDRELVQAEMAKVNGASDPGPIALADRDERADEGSPEITMWCPTCKERAVPMRNGTCGFCDTKLEADDTPENWPHTANVVRRQVVVSDHDRPAAVKRERAGEPARGPILASPSAPDEGDGTPDDVEPKPSSHDPRASPILDWLAEHGTGTAPRIAHALGRKTPNVSTRLRQLEQRGFVRRTGKTVPGGQGGPQIEWELAREDADPTGPEDILTSPATKVPPDSLRRRYFDALLAKIERDDCPEHIYDRIERLVEGSPQ